MVDGYFIIKSKQNGSVFDINNPAQGEGAYLTLHVKTGSDSQLWKLTEEGFLESKLNGLVAEINMASSLNGSRIVLAEKDEDLEEHQLWDFSDDGYIKSRFKEKVLESELGLMWDGTPILTNFAKDTDNQKWIIEKV
ncbi:MAG: hypothetical protein DWQ06_09525 [Calditrichaeota bacterium]|nr:MAG: hypothetical protein DWQ06_09525 [Calditrichota bacterium]